MKNRNILFGSLSIAVVGLAVFAVSGLQAYRGDPLVQGPNHTDERAALMEEIFEQEDYQAWYELMTANGTKEPGVISKVTEDNFSDFVMMREFEADGRLEEAQALRESLGLGLGRKGGEGSGMGENRRSRS